MAWKTGMERIAKSLNGYAFGGVMEEKDYCPLCPPPSISQKGRAGMVPVVFVVGCPYF